MTRKAETEPILRWRAAHRKAKGGDAQGRAFLAAYPVGKPAHEALEP